MTDRRLTSAPPDDPTIPLTSSRAVGNVRSTRAQNQSEYTLSLPLDCPTNQDHLIPPEEFFYVHIYDALIQEFHGIKTLGQTSGKFMITLESSTKLVKVYAGKPGKVADVVNGSKRHDLVLWLGGSPLCVIEVKIIGGDYGVLSGFKNDFERLKSVVKGNKKNTIKCGILAIYDCYEGYSKSDDTLFEKHTAAIEKKFFDRAVDLSFRWKKFDVKGYGENYLAGAICIVSK